MWVKFTPHVTRDTARCQLIPKKYLMTLYARTSRHRIFKLCRRVNQVTHRERQLFRVNRLKVKVIRIRSVSAARTL